MISSKDKALTSGLSKVNDALKQVASSGKADVNVKLTKLEHEAAMYHFNVELAKPQRR